MTDPEHQSEKRPWEVFSPEDLQTPDFTYWTPEKDEAWYRTVQHVVERYSLYSKKQRYRCCRDLKVCFEAEYGAALAQESWRGALQVCDCLYRYLIERAENIGPSYGRLFDFPELKAAVAEGLTMEALAQRCVQGAKQILRDMPASAMDRIWKAAAGICRGYEPGDPFRSALLRFPWPEDRRKALQEILRESDQKCFPSRRDPFYDDDPEPDRPPYRLPVMRGRDKAEREEDVLAEMRQASLKWQAWCLRNRSPQLYRVDLEMMVLYAPWAQMVDLQTLRQCSTDAQWAETREKLRKAPLWAGRQEEIDRIPAETGAG